VNITRGSSLLATLGFVAESLWDSSAQASSKDPRKVQGRGRRGRRHRFSVQTSVMIASRCNFRGHVRLFLQRFKSAVAAPLCQRSPRRPGPSWTVAIAARTWFSLGVAVVKIFLRLGRVWGLILLASVSFGGLGAAPTLVITNIPAYGASGNLQGFVLGANAATQAVAVFIFVPGFGWVTKPTCALPLTTILPDGSWSANINTGGGDATATRVAALLVGTNYNQPCVLGLPNLPTNVYAQAVAKSVITRPSPGVRFLSFSGYDWWVKANPSPIGPGPNYFSDLTNNAWTDTNGWLHLRITNRTNAWQCAEIISARTFGPGNYRFELNTLVNGLDPNVTLGLFTWSDDPTFADREIDVECSRWDNAADTNNSQFVVQPFDAPNHLLRYPVGSKISDSTHTFAWETNRVTFLAQDGPYNPGASNTIIGSWVFTNAAAVPQSGDENVHLNLWLQSGNPPFNGLETEVVIKSFTFVPFGTPPRTLLTGSKVGGHFQCSFNLYPDFWYELQSSTNLAHWTNVATVLATNTSFSFSEGKMPMAVIKFYRAVTLP